MWKQSGKYKALTFSYDDGVTQDIKLIELLNKYGLKATFNLNSELLGKQGSLNLRCGSNISHNKVNPCDVKFIYSGHEIAAHTLTHPSLPTLEEAEIVRQVEHDRLNLCDLCGYEVVGMAYPGGGTNNDDRVAQIIKQSTGIKYSRTITSTHLFAPQKNLHRFNPTVYHVMEKDKLFELAERFLSAKADPENPLLFYVWGHSYEFDLGNNWEIIEEFFKLVSGKSDVFYGTNRQVLLG